VLSAAFIALTAAARRSVCCSCDVLIAAVVCCSAQVPADSLEFVILNGGGAVIREIVGDASRADSAAITHHVVDRPPAKGSAAKSAAAREHVQPQWVYDSFNTRALLPTAPYAPV
jgi:pescadillo